MKTQVPILKLLIFSVFLFISINNIVRADDLDEAEKKVYEIISMLEKSGKKFEEAAKKGKELRDAHNEVENINNHERVEAERLEEKYSQDLIPFRQCREESGALDRESRKCVANVESLGREACEIKDVKEKQAADEIKRCKILAAEKYCIEDMDLGDFIRDQDGNILPDEDLDEAVQFRNSLVLEHDGLCREQMEEAEKAYKLIRERDELEDRIQILATNLMALRIETENAISRYNNKMTEVKNRIEEINDEIETLTKDADDLIKRSDETRLELQKYLDLAPSVLWTAACTVGVPACVAAISSAPTLCLASGPTAPAVAVVDAALVAGTCTASSVACAKAVVSNQDLLKKISQMKAEKDSNSLPKGKVSNPGRMQQEIGKGQGPKTVDRVDKGRGSHEQDHVHFDDKSALNKDGTWKHGGKTLSNKEKKWLDKHNWKYPE